MRDIVLFICAVLALILTIGLAIFERVNEQLAYWTIWNG